MPLLLSDIDVVFQRPAFGSIARLSWERRAVAFMASAYTGVNIGLVWLNAHHASPVGYARAWAAETVANETWDQDAFVEAIKHQPRRTVNNLDPELFVLCCHRHVSWTELCVERARRAPRYVAMHMVCEKDKAEGLKNLTLWAPLRLGQSDCNYKGR